MVEDVRVKTAPDTWDSIKGPPGPPGSGLVPTNSQAADYTLVPDDVGKKIRRSLNSTGDATWTIPADPALFPVGAVIFFTNESPGTVTLIGPPLMRLLQNGEVLEGDIAIGPAGWVRLHKMSDNLWEGVSNFGSSGGGTTIEQGDGITVEGDPAAGYTVAGRLSTDEGQLLDFGSDGGLLLQLSSAILWISAVRIQIEWPTAIVDLELDDVPFPGIQPGDLLFVGLDAYSRFDNISHLPTFVGAFATDADTMKLRLKRDRNPEEDITLAINVLGLRLANGAPIEEPVNGGT